LREFSHLRDAWGSGRLGTATIRMLLERSREIRSQLDRDQQFLVETLEPLTVEHARVVIERWRERVLGELDRSPDDRKPEPVENSVRASREVGDERVVTAIFDRRTGYEFERLL